MAKLEILHFPDPRLRTVAKPVPVVNAEIRRLIDAMFETMYDAPGIGLAATQVNVHQRLLALDVSEDKDQPQVFINPEILSRDGVEEMEEGCLSVPGVYDKVQRAERIRVRALVVTVILSNWKPMACWRCVSSMRLIISTENCSSTICRA